MAVKLDTVVTDRITGFKGVAMSRTEFLDACVRIRVQPKKLVAGKVQDAEYFNELDLMENDPKTTKPINEIIGKVVMDEITGFFGTVVCRTEYYRSSPRVSVQPKGLHEGKPIDSQDFDESRLTWKRPAGIVTAAVKKPGGPGDIAKHMRQAPR
jgi:hypothetical protein